MQRSQAESLPWFSKNQIVTQFQEKVNLFANFFEVLDCLIIDKVDDKIKFWS